MNYNQQHGVQADTYFSEGGPPLQQSNQAYGMRQYANGTGYQQNTQQDPQYTQPPPNYEGPKPTYYDGKQSFEQTFKINKPKYNDLWAGILVGSLSYLNNDMLFDSMWANTLFLELADTHLPRLRRCLGLIPAWLRKVPQWWRIRRHQHHLNQLQHSCSFRYLPGSRLHPVLGLFHSCADFHKAVHLDNGYP